MKDLFFPFMSALWEREDYIRKKYSYYYLKFINKIMVHLKTIIFSKNSFLNIDSPNSDCSKIEQNVPKISI